MQCQHGYIIEKIIDRDCQPAAYEGTIYIENLPPGVRGPLSLCRLRVTGIETMGKRGANFHQWGRHPDQMLEQVCLRLNCEMTDRNGRRLCGQARMVLDIPSGNRPAGTVRKGAQIDLHSACYCAPNAFHICADVLVHTIVSCCQTIVKDVPCRKDCRFDLPLYPHAAHRT